jgi:hypothetical protein
MISSTPPVYLLALGLVLFFIVGLFINKQNRILKSACENMGFTAYNQKKKDAQKLIATWKNPPYAEAVKNIVYLDFLWMLVFGASIFYGLWTVSYSDIKYWKTLCNTGMILIVLMVIIDGLQDVAIYNHLTTGKSFDVRGLTVLKFSSCLFPLLSCWQVLL